MRPERTSCSRRSEGPPMMKLVVFCVLVAIFLGGVQAASPADWRDKVIYQLITDRFARDDDSTAPCTDLDDYCGGTFAGIEKHLDYIKDLGVDAIWMSPIIENFEAGYHGYWAKNLYEVNDHFGTRDSLLSLTTAAHEKGMYMMVDVVANHIGRGVADLPAVTPFNDASFFHDCLGCDSACNVDNYTNLPMMMHCRLYGLPDLNQSIPYVHETLLNWIAGMVSDYSFDGVRIDTVPYISKSFWTDFSASAGVYTLGEVCDGRVEFVANYQPNVNGLFNFPMFYTMINVFRDQESMWLISERIAEVNANFEDPTLLGNFLENHDQIRFLHEQPDVQLYRNAMLFTMTNVGIPVLYYGTEQGDFHNTSNGLASEVSRRPLWTTGYPTTNSPHHLYTFIQTTLKHRKASKMSAEPLIEHFLADSGYAFSRGSSLIALTNVGSNGPLINMQMYNVSEPGTRLCNIYSPADDCVTVGSDRSVSIQLVKGECKLYYPATVTASSATTTAKQLKKKTSLGQRKHQPLQMTTTTAITTSTSTTTPATTTPTATTAHTTAQAESSSKSQSHSSSRPSKEAIQKLIQKSAVQTATRGWRW